MSYEIEFGDWFENVIFGACDDNSGRGCGWNGCGGWRMRGGREYDRFRSGCIGRHDSRVKRRGALEMRWFIYVGRRGFGVGHRGALVTG